MGQTDLQRITSALADLRGAILAIAPDQSHALATALDAASRSIGKTLARRNPGFNPSRWMAECRANPASINRAERG